MKIGSLMSGLLLAGCMVGPDYKRPDVQVPDEFAHAAPTTQPTTQPVAMVLSGAPIVDRWWVGLRDPLLDSLVDRALGSNLDLQFAEARVVEARALRRVVAADLFPQINSTGSYAYLGTSRNAARKVSGPSLAQQVASGTVSGVGSSIASAAGGGAIAGTVTGANPAGAVIGTAIRSVANRYAQKLTTVKIPRDQNLFQAGFDASWEIDVFGGIRRGVEAAEDNIQVSEENLHDLMTTLISEVARNYVEARTYQKRLAIARKNIGTQQENLELTQAKLRAGITSELDVAQAAAQLATTESQIPLLETLWFQAVHRLSVLLGREPSALFEELEAVLPIPASPPQVPVGLPSELLRRRADIRASERQMASATAEIGVAVADLYPRFSINGSFGSRTSDMQHFLDRNSAFWSIGPGFSWPIFQGGRIRANIAVQEARQQQALIQYRSTILLALEEVENALTAYRNEQIRYEHLENAVNANQRAVDLSTERYVKGLTDFLRVLESERSLYVTEDQLAQSEADVVANYIALQKALGGGWQSVVAPSEATDAPKEMTEAAEKN